MPEGLEAQQVRRIFFPKRKHYTFHRINLEYLVPLRSMQRGNIYTSLDAGLRGNLRQNGNSDEILRSLRPQLEGLASRVSVQGVRLLREREHVRKTSLKETASNFARYRAQVGSDFASQKLAESFLERGEEAYQQVLTAETILNSALVANEQNYRAHFELGWLYLFLLGRLSEAEQHFELAVKYARQQDPEFAVFALRHLADARYSLKRHDSAIEAALTVLRETSHTDLEYVYECSRYLAAGGEVELATHRLAEVVKQSPVYYVQAQVEPDFRDHEAVHELLHDLREVRVRRIQHFVQQSWRQHELSGVILPDNVNTSVLFRKTYRRHLHVMAQLPYVTLSQREKQIGRLIISASEKRIVNELKKRSHLYEKKIEKRSRRWVWVNKLGAFCLHSAVILFLACIMFYVVRFALEGAGISGWMGTDRIVGYVFNAVLGLAGVGALMVQFVPPGMRKMLHKQVELDNTWQALTTRFRRKTA